MIINGDSLIELKNIDDNSIDSVVTDPPYGLKFMGKKWDYDVPNRELWQEVLRVLKPGGHLLSFAGSRTYHRMAVNIEDAGFEIRDQIMWVYGSGFPKSHNIGKAVNKLQGNEREVVGKRKAHDIRGNALMEATVPEYKKEKSQIDIEITKGNSEWEGWGTALKPAHEPIVVARKPLSEKTIAKNVLKWGTGGINIDASRVPTSYTDAYTGDGSSESIVPLHKLSELRHKAHTLVLSFLADKKDYQIPSNAEQYVQSWSSLLDYRDDCLICRGLYDELSPLFQEDDQVSFRLLHDVHGDIYRLRKEQSDTLSGQDNDHLSSLDDFLQLILSYSQYTTPDIKSARFPANFIHDGSDEVVELFPDTKSGAVKKATNNGANQPINLGGGMLKPTEGSEGSAARFFKCCTYDPKHAILKVCIKNGNVNIVESDLKTMSAIEKIALMYSALKNATHNSDLLNQNLNALSAEKSVDSTEISFVQNLVAILTGGTTELTGEMRVISLWLKKLTQEQLLNILIQTNNLAWYAEKKTEELIDTMRIIQDLKILYGYVDHAIYSSTQARFKYQSKASKKDRNEGLPEDQPSTHPTVKPTKLMQYLVRLVTPKGGTVLDPFMGSGSTGKACKLEGFDFVGIELDPEYCKIAEARIKAVE